MIKSVLLSHVYMYVFLISISKLSLALQVIKYRMMSFIYFIAVEYYMSQIVDSETRFLGKPLLLQFFSRLRANIFALKSPMSRVLSNSFKYIRKGISFWVPKHGGALPPKFMFGGLRTPLPPPAPSPMWFLLSYAMWSSGLFVAILRILLGTVFSLYNAFK